MDVVQEISPQIKLILWLILGAAIAYLFFHYVIKELLHKLKPQLKGAAVPLNLLHRPLVFLLPSLFVMLILPIISLPAHLRSLVNHFLSIWLILGVAWLIVRAFMLLKAVILSRYNLDAEDNLKARQINTQVSVIQRVVIVLVSILAASTILMTFETVRQIGISLLASAGIAGIIIGFAAQKSLATLIAGIQLAITQPIRLDDVVIVENEWGRIEEITLTYVVVRIWDQRRLVVPITYFIERPFQNWTRRTAELLGTIYIYADYSTSIDLLRAELEKIVADSPLWDKRVAKIQVTNVTEKTIELRALISAANSSDAWELRCLVREQLIAFMQRNYPEKLPRIRLEPIKKAAGEEHHNDKYSV